jgi:hypothetical protein
MNLSIYEFTDEELKSNKRGFISPGQKKMINGMAGGIRRSQMGNAKVAIIFPFIGLCMVLGLSLSNEDSRAAFFASPMNLIVLILLVPLIIGIFALSIYFANKRADRLTNSELSVVEGMVRLDESHSSKVGSTYYAILGKTKFAFPEDVSGIFQEGEKYRIYYCQTSMLKLILSYERM